MYKMEQGQARAGRTSEHRGHEALLGQRANPRNPLLVSLPPAGTRALAQRDQVDSGLGLKILPKKGSHWLVATRSPGLYRINE